MAGLDKKERASLIRRFAGRLKFPQLFFLLVLLFFVDLFLVDPIPFIDEAILGLLAVLMGMWRERREQKPHSMKNVTPSG